MDHSCGVIGLGMRGYTLSALFEPTEQPRRSKEAQRHEQSRVILAAAQVSVATQVLHQNLQGNPRAPSI